MPANSEGVVENSGHVQIPIPLQLLQSQFMQQQTNKQQDMVPQNVQGQPQVLAIKSDPQNPVEQQSQGQKQQVATIQLLPQQVQYLQHAYSSVEPQSTPNPGFMQHQQHTPGKLDFMILLEKVIILRSWSLSISPKTELRYRHFV